MKNKRLSRGISGSLLALLMLAGCESKQEKDQRLTRQFAQWMTKKADIEAKANFGERYDKVYDEIDDWNLDFWIYQVQQDSVKYRDALERDAKIVLDYTKKCKTASDVWNKIQKAPTYTYGPGSFKNKQGEWEYGEHINNGLSREHLCCVNYGNYKNSLEELYCMRQAKAKRK